MASCAYYNIIVEHIFETLGNRIAKLCPVLILLLRMDSASQGISRACPIVIGDSPTASKHSPVKLTKRAEEYRYADSWLRCARRSCSDFPSVGVGDKLVPLVNQHVMGTRRVCVHVQSRTYRLGPR